MLEAEAALLAPRAGGNSRAMSGAARMLLAASAVLLMVGVVAMFAGAEGDDMDPIEAYSALRTGRYAIRAERQAHNYELDAEREISLATGYDSQATEERRLSAEEESRARKSSYLAADSRTRVKHVLQEGRQQVNQATTLKSHSQRLQDKAESLTSKARTDRRDAEGNYKSYKQEMAQYGTVVDRVNRDKASASKVYRDIRKLSLKLADVATKYHKAAVGKEVKKATQLKLQLGKIQKQMDGLEQKKPAARAAWKKAADLEAKHRPQIQSADEHKRDGDLAYGHYAVLTRAADALNKHAEGLLDRAQGLDGLIKETEKDLRTKRKAFLHYKSRSQTELAISVNAEDREDSLRALARKSRFHAAQLFDKANRLRSLAQTGVDKVMAATKKAAPATESKMMGLKA